MGFGVELVVGGAVVLFVLALAAAVYYDPVAASRFRGFTGASLGSAVLAGCLGCVAVVGLAAAGRRRSPRAAAARTASSSSVSR